MAHSARQIVALPIVQAEAPDEDAVLAAAFYHEAGWISYLATGGVAREDILMRPVPEEHRERAADFMAKSLAPLLSRKSLARARRAMRTLRERRIKTIEGQVVADAVSLEEFGALSLWMQVRRSIREGKGVQAMIETWRRRKEYGYWEARLDDSFQLGPVRDAAARRVKALTRLLEEFERQQEGVGLPSSPRHGGETRSRTATTR